MKNIGIVLFDQFEPLDMVGPFEVFTFARAAGDRFEPLFKVYTIAKNMDAVESVGGLRVLPDYTFENCPHLELLVVPGGMGTRTIDPAVIDWVKSKADLLPKIASVCTGALVLAKAGVLHGKSATTHWLLIDQLRQDYPDVIMLEDQRWVEDGNFFTCQGVSAGIDMSLHILRRMHSLTVAEWTARLLQYRWNPDPSSC